MSPHVAAAREAEDEGGVKGQVSKIPLGRFTYQKRLAEGRLVKAKVVVFPLEVTKKLSDWKEKGERKRRWFPAAKAAELVDEEELAKLIRKFKPAERKSR